MYYYCDQNRCVMKLFNLEMDSTLFTNNIWILYLLSLIMCESLGKK